MSQSTEKAHAIPFRDSSGNVFYEDGADQRRRNGNSPKNYRKLIESGLYDQLLIEQLIVPHDQLFRMDAEIQSEELLLRPQSLPIASYSYEWCFSQLKDAALTILRLQRIAMQFDMSLKSASAKNIQFVKGVPQLVDASAFEQYVDGRPWIAYRQFCQHFLAPLSLMSYVDVRLNLMLQTHLDGIPLDLSCKLLPRKTWLKPGLLMHLLMHARGSNGTPNEQSAKTEGSFGRAAMSSLIDSLESIIGSLKLEQRRSETSDFGTDANFPHDALTQKQAVVAEYVKRIEAVSVWDLSAGTGVFSRLAASQGCDVLSLDAEPFCVEKNYLEMKAKNECRVIPLVVDISAPSPGLGWANESFRSLAQRGHADVLLSLGNLHQLIISKGLDFDGLGNYFVQIGKYLIVEFIPHNDPQAQRLWTGRADSICEYTQAAFERDFSKYYAIEDREQLVGTCRWLYLMRSR